MFLGSAVTYDIRAKAKILGVNADLLAREGAVHPEVARQMAAGTAQLYRQTEDGDCVIGLQGQDRMVTNLPAWCTSAAPCPVASMAFVRVKQLLMSCV